MLMPNALPKVAPASRSARRARRLARALRAPAGRKWLWLRSLFLVTAVRVGLWTLSLQRLQVLVARLGRARYSAPIPMQNSQSAATVDEPGEHGLGEHGLEDMEAGAGAARDEAELNWAITRAARFVPGASCLTQALSLQVLLARRGLGSRLCIGVRKGGQKSFEAHAWVERGGRVLIGGEAASSDENAGRDKWTPLTAWDFFAERLCSAEPATESSKAQGAQARA